MAHALPRRAVLGWLASGNLLAQAQAQPGWVPGRLDALETRLRQQHPMIRAFLMERTGATPFSYFRPGTTMTTRSPVESVTKSVTSLLAGIAIDKGAFTGVDESLAAIFPEHAKGAQGKALAQVKLRHLLSMSSGFVQGTATEDSEYFGFAQRLFAPGLLAHALSRKVAYTPGTRFYYSNMDAHLVAVAIARRISKPLMEFAREELFAPLGIEGAEWMTGHDGVPNGAADLLLTPAEMVRIGRMMLARGKWEGRQVVPQAYVQASTSKQVVRDPRGEPHKGYGWLWWTDETPGDRHPIFAAAGYGGQFIYVAPALDLVIVSLTERDSRAEAERTASLIRDGALPAVAR